MGRIIETGETPAKKRRAHMRSCAEVLRLLAERPVFDAEGKDMASFLVFNLRGIYQTIDESAAAWDERNYWKKAEGLREKWRWARTSSEELERLIRGDAWHEVPQFLIGLIQYFSGVRVTKLTRDSDWWVGAHRALLRKGP
ncbi:MAG: hypothetical protein HKN29_16780 [Rhodothermales bacterium]|nr:hypothetical protein [Rhodothermales bacterium]